jgi:phospholipid/cholesterol/gamma-HCH transport system substrate-binding protein
MTRRRLLPLVSTLLAVALLAGACRGGEGPMELDVELARAHNLFAGSPVKVMGVEVGSVHRLRSPAGSEAAVATVRLDRDVVLPEDVTAKLVQGTVLGERFIQLDPPYTEGPTLDRGATIPLERTAVPAEFDELLSSLEAFLEGLPADEVDRFLRNVADTLVGQGDRLGESLEATARAVEVLRERDDDLVELIVGAADLSETLAGRDAQLRALLTDYSQLTGTLATERDAIDLALAEAARLLVEVEDLLEEQGERLGANVEVLTRVGRTIDRNHTELERTVVGQAELFRHAERVFDRERNWLPLINHAEDLGRVISERLSARLAGLCDRAGLAECASLDFWTAQMPARVCLDPLLTCEIPEGEEPAAGLGGAMDTALQRVPELEDELAPPEPREPAADDEERDEDEAASRGTADEDAANGGGGALGELLGGALGGGGR